MGSRINEAERVARIGEVFAKHGVGYLLEKRRAKKQGDLGEHDVAEIRAENLRKAFEELGPSFMKLGQLLSNRPDVIEQEYVEEFSKLRRKAPRIPIEDVRSVLRTEIGDPEEVFDTFDEEPIAAASIGQVHRATVDGEEYVVKVQRPGIQGDIEADFKIVKDFMPLIRSLMIERIPHEPLELVEELESDMEKQLDYTVEGRNCERVRRNMRDVEGVRVPGIHWELSTNRVLVQEFMEGEVLEDLMETGEIREYDREWLASSFAEAYLKMIFVDGFFHADPHPANIIVKRDCIALIDFGSAGRMTNELRRLSSAFYIAVMLDYTDIAAEVVMEISGSETDVGELEWDIEYFTDLMYLPIRTALVATDLPKVLSKHDLRLPREFVLVDRSLDALTGVAMEVYPEFSFRDMLEPFMERATKTEFSVGSTVGRGVSRAFEVQESISDLPQALDEAARSLADGDLVVRFEHEAGGLVEEIDRATSRLSYSIIVASLVTASGVSTLADLGPSFLGFNLFGLFGYVLAVAMGIALLLNIWRTGKLR